MSAPEGGCSSKSCLILCPSCAALSRSVGQGPRLPHRLPPPTAGPALLPVFLPPHAAEQGNSGGGGGGKWIQGLCGPPPPHHGGMAGSRAEPPAASPPTKVWPHLPLLVAKPCCPQPPRLPHRSHSCIIPPVINSVYDIYDLNTYLYVCIRRTPPRGFRHACACPSLPSHRPKARGDSPGLEVSWGGLRDSCPEACEHPTHTLSPNLTPPEAWGWW